MKHYEALELKTDLSFSIEKLSRITDELPEKLKEIKSSDSNGEDVHSMFELIEGIKSRFKQYASDLESPFKIAVVGSQGTGKSTIINLLLGDDLMPSSTMENESAIIRLVYPPNDSKENMALFEMNDDTTSLMTIEEANKKIDKAIRNKEDKSFKNIKYVTYFVKNKSLKEIELINTPGMNVLTDDFYPKVKHLFIEADVILWVNSAEQILDKFNSGLIRKIHADNNKIVGFITFPDKLYRQDEQTGVTDVVSQFMQNLENNQLLRVNDEIGLFVINGKFAQIAHSQKKALKFIFDIEELEDEEDKLRMIYNYLHHGFAYSDDAENKSILKDFRLYGISKMEDSMYDESFDIYKFFQHCLDIDLCTIDEDGVSASYTKKGRELLGEVSQYNAFGRFTEEYLIPLSQQSKLDSVKGRLQRSLSKNASEDNSISRIFQIKEQLQSEKEKLGTEEKDRLSQFQNIIKILEKDYVDWCNRNIGFAADTFTDELLEEIFEKIEKEIGILDMFKEIGNSLIPGFLKRNKETAISKKTSKVIEDSMLEVLPKNLKALVNSSNTQIEIILLKMQKDFLANKTLKNEKIDFQSEQNFNATLDSTAILKKINAKLTPVLAKLITQLLKNIAKKDLRKGANTFFKKNVIKPIVKLVRRLLQKKTESVLMKKVVTTASKAGTGPLGWILLVADLGLIGNDLRVMFKQIKDGLKETLKDERSFKNIFEEEANRTFEFIIEAVVKELNHNFTDDKTDETFILDGIDACDNVIKEITKFNND